MRFFNTTGPVVAADHYCIPPLARLDVDELLRLVRDKRYFVLHAPRQTGKTSALLALRDLLNSGAWGSSGAHFHPAPTGQRDLAVLDCDFPSHARPVQLSGERPGGVEHVAVAEVCGVPPAARLPRSSAEVSSVPRQDERIPCRRQAGAFALTDGHATFRAAPFETRIA